MRKRALMGWLAGMPAGFQNEVLARLEHRALPAGNPVYLIEDEARGIYGLEDGMVEVRTMTGTDAPNLIYLARRGWWFGALEVFTNRPRRFQIETRTDCSFALLQASHVREICAKDPRYWESFVQLMCGNYEAMVDAIAMMRHPSPLWRVTKALLILYNRQSETVPDVEATQADIASIANLSPRSAAGALAELEEAGIIRRGYRSVVVLDPQRLSDCADSIVR